MIIGEQILNSFECAKWITSDQTVNSALANSIFIKKSSQYFDPIDIQALAHVYLQTYQIILNDITTKENSKSTSITYLDANQNNNKQVLFFSTTVQQLFRNKIDNYSNLLNQDLDRKFVLGDMLIDAAMCITKDNNIIQKIQQKYNFNSLIGVLDMSDESFHFLEVVIWLLRSCYLNQNIQLIKIDESQISVIKQYIYKQLEKITDLNNINQIRFATESITLLSNCSDKMNKGDNLQTKIGSLLVSLLKDMDVYAIPNAIDFASGDAQTFNGYKFILDHNRIVDNEWYERDVVVETHQKELAAVILRLLMKWGIKELSFMETKLKPELFVCLNMNEQMIEKLIVLLILKYVDIPFDVDFTDQLFETLLHLQSKPEDSLPIEIKNKPTDHMLIELLSETHWQIGETDCEYTEFSQIVQNAIVWIHNCEITRNTQNLDDIEELIRNIIGIQEDKNKFRDKSVDSRFAIILAELLYKVRWNSTFIEIRQNMTIYELVVKVYKLLGHFMYNRQQIWIRLWYFSQKLFCMKWWNEKLNRYHAEFFLCWVEGLGEYKTTLYTKELFAKVCKSIGDVLVTELQKKLKGINDESKNELLLFITKIGDQYQYKKLKVNEEEEKEEIKEMSNEESIEENKKENENENKEESKKNCEEENNKKSEEESREENKEESKIINGKISIKGIK